MRSVDGVGEGGRKRLLRRIRTPVIDLGEGVRLELAGAPIRVCLLNCCGDQELRSSTLTLSLEDRVSQKARGLLLVTLCKVVREPVDL